MIQIVYRPGITSKVEKNEAVFDILWEDANLSSMNQQTYPTFADYVKIRNRNIYMDLAVASKKISAIRITWQSLNVKRIYIYLSDNLLHQNALILENVICSILNEFLPDIYLTNICITVTHVSDKPNDIVDEIIHKSRKVLSGRMLAMLPGNIGTPIHMVNVFKKLFRKVPNVKITVFTPEQILKKGFGLIHGVGNSAKAKPYFMVIERKGQKTYPKKVAVVGKGITFDSGGLAIKGFDDMSDMKYDKIGAIYGAMALMHLMEDKEWKDVTFIGAFPFAENAVSETALRPGDVVKSYLGKTVEITNPDAEGRLVLADAFGYLHKYKPDIIVDIATLTGHASDINCFHNGYYFANQKDLKEKVEWITDRIGERMIPMPTWNDYNNILQSNVADLNNSPWACSDAYTAALFLQEFIPKDVCWLHIDLAHEFDNKHIPNGNGIRTIIAVLEYLLRKK